MKKIYKLMENRSEEEKRTGKASYKTVFDRFIQEGFLCNNIRDIDTSIWENISVGDLYYYIDKDGNERTREEYENDETGEIYEEAADIYQYFLCNLSKLDIEELQELEEENKDNSIILSYSDLLDCDVLMVTHWGTSWDYVLTNIELTENIEEV